MSLPQALYQKQKERHHELLTDLASHISHTALTSGFMGDNWNSFTATVEELLVQAKAFNNKYSGDHLIPEEPNVQSLSAWKQERKLQGVG
jgi:hypothetical protein